MTKKLMEEILLAKPRKDDRCEDCGKDIFYQAIDIDGEKKYLNIKRHFCDDCLRRKLEKEKAREEEEKQTRRKELTQQSTRVLQSRGVPYPNPNDSQFTDQDKEMVRAVIEGMLDGKSYLIIASVGIGKSYYASFVAKQLFLDEPLHYGNLLYVRLRDVDLEVRRTFDEEGSEATIINKYRRTKRLVIEIADHETTAKRTKSQHLSDLLLDILEPRYRHWRSGKKGMPTLFVSTQSSQNLKAIFDESVTSRITEMSDKIFVIRGENRRTRGKEDKTIVIQHKLKL